MGIHCSYKSHNPRRSEKFLGIIEESKKSQHKECSKERLSRYEEDVKKVKNTIRSWKNPFDKNEDLINISSGTVAPDSLANDLFRSS